MDIQEILKMTNQGGATAPQTASETKYNTPESAGADYSLGGKVGNFFTGANTAAENKANALNQFLSEERQKEFNAAEAQKDRDWQEMMSNTAYQRAMADAEKAGINPYYVIQNGSTASTPGGATASATTKAPENKQANRGTGGALLSAIMMGLKIALTASGQASAAAGVTAAETAVKTAKKKKITLTDLKRQKGYDEMSEGGRLNTWEIAKKYGLDW